VRQFWVWPWLTEVNREQFGHFSSLLDDPVASRLARLASTICCVWLRCGYALGRSDPIWCDNHDRNLIVLIVENFLACQKFFYDCHDSRDSCQDLLRPVASGWDHRDSSAFHTTIAIVAVIVIVWTGYNFTSFSFFSLVFISSPSLLTSPFFFLALLFLSLPINYFAFLSFFHIL